MDQATLTLKITDLIAHRTPEELARDLILAQESNAQLQKEVDSHLFSQQPQTNDAPAGPPPVNAADRDLRDEGDDDDGLPDADTDEDEDELDDSDRP